MIPTNLRSQLCTYDAHVIYKVCEYTEKADRQQMWRMQPTNVAHATVLVVLESVSYPGTTKCKWRVESGTDNRVNHVHE